MRNRPLDPLWLARLQARASQPPARERVPFYLGRALVGSVEPDFLDQVASTATRPPQVMLRREIDGDGLCWRLHGEAAAALDWLAQALRALGLAGVWRDEPLGVADAQGRRVGCIERAAVRPLGIATQAVHLVGTAAQGGIWVQQRALTKANDPGLWDTLMGGMVSSAETLDTALQRETWEEAGLRLQELNGLACRGRLSVARPCPDGGAAGYLREQTDWFTATLPAGLSPVNQDGEVAQFVLLPADELVCWLERDRFTVEAALILVAALGLN